jgi:uncharacterized protein
LHALFDVGHSLRESFFMLWDTLWALVLGFGLSGAVQAFVPRSQMERLLGRGGPREIARASLLGAASSSCSYAAASLAKTLFQRGADFATSMVFMFASTNLVIELGIVLWVLIGWQFALAEVVGGILMIALFALVARLVVSRQEIEAARVRLGATGAAAPGGSRRGPASLAGWAEAARRALADAKMLRQELVVGYVVAGFLAVLVPTSVWHDVFVSGHGFWTSLENVAVGPFIAIVSFVCSIGNVPLAAALWHGGIGFGGVVSFVFADLITLPLVLVYRRYYGGHLTLKLVAVFWTVMSAAGLAVEYLFRAASIEPTKRPVVVAPTSFRWNYTTYLDIVFLLVLAALWWLAQTERGDALDRVTASTAEARR